jgi:multiple sugar transport system permease protein
MDIAENRLGKPSSRKKSFWDRSNVAGYVFISPWLIGFLVFTLIPMLASLYYSFTDYNLLGPPDFVGLANYEEMFTADAKFIQSIKVTLKFVAISVPLRLLFALFIAMLFTVKTRIEGMYRAVYYLPSLIGGSVAIAVLWRRVFAADGIFNSILGLIGIEAASNWLGNPKTSLMTLIVLAAWQFGSPMLIFLAALKQIPQQLYEAAKIDGANSVQVFFRITLPLLTPIIFFNFVMQMIVAFPVVLGHR